MRSHQNKSFCYRKSFYFDIDDAGGGPGKTALRTQRPSEHNGLPTKRPSKHNTLPTKRASSQHPSSAKLPPKNAIRPFSPRTALSYINKIIYLLQTNIRIDHHSRSLHIHNFLWRWRWCWRINNNWCRRWRTNGYRCWCWYEYSCTGTAIIISTTIALAAIFPTASMNAVTFITAISTMSILCLCTCNGSAHQH